MINGASVSGSKTGMRSTLKSQITTKSRIAMSIKNNRQRNVRPTHPGEMLREDFLPDYQLSVSRFAASLGVSRQTVNELLRERRAVSAEMALRLARFFGNSPEFWLNAQRAVDLWDTMKNKKSEIDRISPISAA
jgi:antitoxin HigA-1